MIVDPERLRDLIAKLRHPMVNEAGAHAGPICQAERAEAARYLELLLPGEEGDGTAR